MKIKKIIKSLSLSLVIFTLSILFVSPVLAIDPGPAPTGIPTKPLPEMIRQISNVILIIVGSVAVLFLIIGGFQYITAAGNPDQAGKAKSTIMYAIIGLVVCILSYVVVSFVTNAIK